MNPQKQKYMHYSIQPVAV